MGDVPRAIDWGFLRELFVEMNLTLGEGVSLNELAEFHGVACDVAHVRARAERWEEVLTERSRVYERARSASQAWLDSRPDGSNIRLQFLRHGLGPMELTYCISAFLAHLGGERSQVGAVRCHKVRSGFERNFGGADNWGFTAKILASPSRRPGRCVLAVTAAPHRRRSQGSDQEDRGRRAKPAHAAAASSDVVEKGISDPFAPRCPLGPSSLESVCKNGHGVRASVIPDG